MPQEGYRCVDCLDFSDRCDVCRERRAGVRRKLRATRRATGLCTECGKKAKAGHARCRKHVKDNAARSLASHQRARAVVD